MFGFSSERQPTRNQSATTGNANKDADKKSQPQKPDPAILGNGMAAKAANSIRNRQAQIDAALGYANGGEVKKGIAPGTKGSGTVGQKRHVITDYAAGGRTQRQLAELGLADGGRVKGPGNGISDDVPGKVAEGSYILPADTTQSLDELTDVRVSNGEHGLSPEQVHAIGVQTLDAVKNATHVPAEIQAQGMQAKGFAPGGRVSGGDQPPMFFADGGSVRRKDDEARMFVDSSGNATKSLPSQSRAVVPAGPVTTHSNSTAVTPSARPSTSVTPAATPQAQPGNADFYGNSRGDMGRGFQPSSSRAVVPVGAQPSAPAAETIDTQGARDTVRARAAADTAAYERDRAARADSFKPASGNPVEPPAKGAGFGTKAREVLNKAGKGGALLMVAPAIASSMEEDSTARYAKRFGMSEPTGDGSLGDIAHFAALRGLGFASDLGSVLTGGLADGLYRDKQGVDETMLAATAGGGTGAVAGNKLGKTGGQLIDKALTGISRGRYKGNIAEKALGGTGTVAGGTAGAAGGMALVAPDAQASQSQAAQAPTQAPQSPVSESATPAAQEQAQTQESLPIPTANQPNQPLQNNVVRDGNSFSGGVIRPGFTVNGQGFNPSGIERSPQNERAVQSLMARTPELGQGQQAQSAPQGGGFRVAGIRQDSNPRLDETWKAATTPIKGARGLTASQLATQRSLIESQERNQTALQTNAADNQTALTREAMADQRSARQEAGLDRRYDKSYQLDAARTGAQLDAQSIQNNAALRSERLYQAYENAAPEDRPAIAKQIRDLSGKDDPQRYTVVPGGQGFTPEGMPYTMPSMVLNNQTGEFVNGPTNRGTGGAPAANIPSNHISALKNNPALAAQFDAQYGQGAAAYYLGDK